MAQQSTLSGRLSDASTGEGVIGAVVELTPLITKQAPQFTASGYDGAVKFASVSYGKYVIKATFMGYDEYADTINVNKPNFVLHEMKIAESATQIDAVVKEVQAMRTSQQGDTLSYNASAFKVAADADVEGLLKKMPGITITDGEVTAQGETIKKIYVDGREFFGNDVTAAINSLPAEIVESIDVYDKLSDNAELSGMDDGEGYKSINIVTKPNMREGFFGKMYAGYGYQPEVQGDIAKNKYNAGANINYFKDKHRLSLLALFNNVNKQNFSFDDILDATGGGDGGSKYMVRPQPGVAEVGAMGVNYSGSFGESDDVKVAASYFYNGTKTTNDKQTYRWYEDPMPIDTLYTENESYTPNYNHRVDARVEWKITPTQQLTLRQKASSQINNPLSTTLGAQWGESGYKLMDSYNLADKRGYSSTTGLSYIKRLGKPGRTISSNMNMSFRRYDNQANSYSNSARKFYLPGHNAMFSKDTVGLDDIYEDRLYDITYSSIFTPTETRNLSGNITYAEPLTSSLRLMLKYNVSNNRQQTSKSSYYTDSDFDITGLDKNPATSNSRETEYMTHQVGPGLYYIKGKSKFTVSANYQLSQLEGSAVLNGSNEKQPIKNTYRNFTYAAMGHLYFNKTTSLRMQLFSRTASPWVSYLVDAYNISNKQNISHGNSKLQPVYKQSLQMRFIHSNVERASTFMFMSKVEKSDDFVATHVVYNPNEFEVDGTTYEPMQYSTYVNLDNKWAVRAMMDYGFPVPLIKCNLNLKGSVNYTQTPSMFGGFVENDGSVSGGNVNITENMGYTAGAVLGSNISEYVDFTFSWNGQYNEATNSAAQTNEKNKYLSQSASASMKFVFGAGFTFSTNVNYNQYKGLTNDYNDSFVLCNAFIGKKIFRNQRGEINIGVNDIFDQNTSFSRMVASGYTQNVLNSVIGRYVSLQFVYNLRSFGSKGSRTSGTAGHGGNGRRPSGGHGHMF